MSQQSYDPIMADHASPLLGCEDYSTHNRTEPSAFTATTTSTSTSTSTSTAVAFDVADMKKTPNIYLLGGGALLMLMAVGVFIPLVVLFPPAAATIPLVGTLAIPGTGGVLVGTVIFPALSGILAFFGLACLVSSAVPRSRPAGHRHETVPAAAAANAGWIAPGWSRVCSLAGGAYGLAADACSNAKERLLGKTKTAAQEHKHEHHTDEEEDAVLVPGTDTKTV